MTLLSPELERLAPLTDEELVGRIVDGDTAAFELLMRRHNQRLFRLARSILRDDGEAEEVVQETYLRAYANLARFEGRSSVITWLSRIALHEALRRRRRQRRCARPAQDLDLDELPMNDPTSGGPDPLDRADLRAVLSHAMDALPAAMRAVVMLRLVEGLSTRETAGSLRLSEGAVKVCLYRARRALRTSLERQSLAELRDAFAFGHERCDRVVQSVFQRLHGFAQE